MLILIIKSMSIVGMCVQLPNWRFFVLEISTTWSGAEALEHIVNIGFLLKRIMYDKFFLR